MKQKEEAAAVVEQKKKRNVRIRTTYTWKSNAKLYIHAHWINSTMYAVRSNECKYVQTQRYSFGICYDIASSEQRAANVCFFHPPRSSFSFSFFILLLYSLLFIFIYIALFVHTFHIVLQYYSRIDVSRLKPSAVSYPIEMK